MKRAAAALLALGLSTGCAGAGSSSETPQDEAAHAETDPILTELVMGTPAKCRSLGMRKECDGEVADYSAAGIEKRVAFLKLAKTKLEAISLDGLSDDARLDVQLLRLAVREELFRLDELKLWTRRPSFYQELFAVDDYLTREYAPLDERAASLKKHADAALMQSKHVFANLRGPMPRAFVETDIEIYKGYADYLRGDVVKLLEKVQDKALSAGAIASVKKLADEAQGIADRLKDGELPRADSSHVLGPDRYKELLGAQEALDIDLAAFEKMARDDLEKNKKAYEELSDKGVAMARPKAEALLTTARTMVVDAKTFIEKNNIVSIPKEGKLQVKESPPFMRWNSAFLNGVGPFDPPDLVSYYYITLPSPEWPSREQEEYIMPNGTLLATSVHEVFPGHFLQGLRARNAPTRAQLMLDSYSFVEGWAHYAEQMMIEQGFGNKTPENQLGQLGDALLRNCRFVASIGLHTKNMTTAEAAKLFMTECKQDRKTAEQQAARGTFDPGYFAYTLGKLQIMELRAAAEEALGPQFDLKKFHDALLSHGSPPVPLIRDRVLRELGAPP